MKHAKKIIITGGPGAGKSTLLAELKKLGYTCYEEVAREVIRKEMQHGSAALPWIDLPAYSSAVFDLIVKRVKGHQLSGVSFFDRGAADVVAYLRHGNCPVPEYMLETIPGLGYHNQVFITPPWREIFVNDYERTETFEMGEAIFYKIREIYSELGFELVEVPRNAVEQRLMFVLERLK